MLSMPFVRNVFQRANLFTVSRKITYPRCISTALLQEYNERKTCVVGHGCGNGTINIQLASNQTVISSNLFISRANSTNGCKTKTGFDSNISKFSADHKLLPSTYIAIQRRLQSTDKQSEGNDIVKENIVTVPNLLTLSRAILSPVLGYLVVTGSYPWALGIFVYAGVTDWLDGWIARRWPSQRTVCGTVVDPIADKLLIVIFTGSLCTVNLIPSALAFLIIFKDVCMVLGGLALRWQSIDKPVTLKKFTDFKLPSMEMKPLTISKINTALQISTLAISLAAPVFGFVGHPALQALWWSTGFSTVATGISYVFAKDAYEIKSKKK